MRLTRSWTGLVQKGQRIFSHRRRTALNLVSLKHSSMYYKIARNSEQHRIFALNKRDSPPYVPKDTRTSNTLLLWFWTEHYPQPFDWRTVFPVYLFVIRPLLYEVLYDENFAEHCSITLRSCKQAGGTSIVGGPRCLVWAMLALAKSSDISALPGQGIDFVVLLANPSSFISAL